MLTKNVLEGIYQLKNIIFSLPKMIKKVDKTLMVEEIVNGLFEKKSKKIFRHILGKKLRNVGSKIKNYKRILAFLFGTRDIL